MCVVSSIHPQGTPEVAATGRASKGNGSARKNVIGNPLETTNRAGRI